MHQGGSKTRITKSQECRHHESQTLNSAKATLRNHELFTSNENLQNEKTSQTLLALHTPSPRPQKGIFANTCQKLAAASTKLALFSYASKPPEQHTNMLQVTGESYRGTLSKMCANFHPSFPGKRPQEIRVKSPRIPQRAKQNSFRSWGIQHSAPFGKF